MRWIIRLRVRKNSLCILPKKLTCGCRICCQTLEDTYYNFIVFWKNLRKRSPNWKNPNILFITESKTLYCPSNYTAPRKNNAIEWVSLQCKFGFLRINNPGNQAAQQRRRRISMKLNFQEGISKILSPTNLISRAVCIVITQTNWIDF